MAQARPPALIAYDGLPIASGGAHTLRLRDRRAIWERMSRFFAAFTTCREPGEVRLVVAEGAHVNDSFFRRAHSLATSEFGSGSRRVAIAGAVTEYEHAWSLRPEQIDPALELMDRLPPIPERLGRGVLVLSIEAFFFLCDPETGKVLAGQGTGRYGDQAADGHVFLGQSRVYLRLSRRSTCALFLSFPFPALTDDARHVIGAVAEALPFRLSSAGWARWQLNARGTQYYKRRLAL